MKALPQTLNAHAGAIVNSIRSSLDLLSAALARRNGKTPSSDTHFPIWTNPNDFADPMWGVHGTERKKWLTENERRIIELLKPYPGGDDDLVALHRLDVVRRHERLIAVTVLPGSIRIAGEAAAAGVRRAPHWPAFHKGAVLALSPRDASEHSIYLSLVITFNEHAAVGHSPVFSGRPLVFPYLFRLGRLADGIVRRFDYA